jgi:ribosome-binding ATPase YchF (GTP1/OBG family)
LVDKVRAQAEKEGADVVEICGKLEAEIAALETQEEKDMFLEESGITESGLARMIPGELQGPGYADLLHRRRKKKSGPGPSTKGTKRLRPRR